jgi:capsular polysaccharide biosynthesis protein
MGYSEKDYIPYNYNHLRVKKLVIPSYPKFDREDLPVAPSLLLWLRERLLSSINVNKSNKKPYVFISRKDSSKQARIANESEISQALSIYDFDTVVLGELELDQQIALFANAKIIVATHGAGLTNLMYSTNPKVIEIFPPGSFRKTFYALTHVVKGSYMAIVAQKRNENGAWCVDINQLLGAIKQLMSKE